MPTPQHPTLLRAGPLRRRILALYALLLAANLGAWAWAALLFRGQPVLLGTAMLAYGFGLRHAVDADHIAAIDNVTRKLVQAGRRPVAAGLFFAIGHSSVVILATAGVAAGATALAGPLERLRAVGSVVGTLVSALFLLAVAAANLAILRELVRGLRQLRRGTADAPDPGPPPAPRGLLGLLLRPLLRLVTRSWHMAPLGFLFGLGFDTATEVALLGLSATQAAKGMPIWSIMVFPALFAAGMSLIDATDGILMLRAYDWALARPARKLWYNLAITLVSVAVALLVGTVEALGLLADRLAPQGRFWRAIGALNDNLDALGLAVIGLLIAIWIGSVIAWRYLGLDDPDPTPADR